MKAAAEIEEHTLHKFKFGLIEAISPHVVESRVEAERFEEHIRVTIRGYVWSHYLGTHTIMYPADWCEAVEERFFPKFLLERFPVRYHIEKIEMHALYPNYRPVIPDEDYVFRAITIEEVKP